MYNNQPTFQFSDTKGQQNEYQVNQQLQFAQQVFQSYNLTQSPQYVTQQQINQNPDEYNYNPQNQTFVQQVPVNSNFMTAQIMNYPKINPCNPCQAGPLHMSVQVVTKEEIEAPWRQECEYLQSVISELESKKSETRIVEKIVEKEKIVKDTEGMMQLETQLNRLRRESEQDQLQLRNQLTELQQQNRDLNGQLRAKDQEFQSFKSSGMNSQSKYSQLEAEFNRYKSEFKGKDMEINQLSIKLHEYEDQLNRYQSQISSLEQQLRMKDSELENKNRIIQQLQSSVSDSSKYREYELRCSNLEGELVSLKQLLNTRNQECESLRLRLSNYEKDNANQINQYRYQISDLEQQVMNLTSEIDKLRNLLRQRQMEIEDLNMRIQQLEESGTTVIQERVTYLSQEIEVWKQKFIKLNHEYNVCQESLIMCQAELEALQKQSKKEVTVERTTRTVGGTTTVQRSQVGGTTTQSRQYGQF